MVTVTGSGGRAAALSLYRSILRAHTQYLPPAMRELGDTYIMSEFRLHRSVTDQDRLGQFFTSWRGYLDQIVRMGRLRTVASMGALQGRREGGGEGRDGVKEDFNFGTHLPDDVELSEEQSERLDQLKMEAVKAGSLDTKK